MRITNVYGVKLDVHVLVIFIHLKLWVAVARHNFKWMRIWIVSADGQRVDELTSISRRIAMTAITIERERA